MNLTNRLFYSSKVNSTELLRSLSLFDVDTFNVRIFAFNDLLDAVNSRLGYIVKNKVLSSSEIEERVLSFFLKKVKLDNPSYLDVKHFLQTTNNIRLQITESNELDKINSIVEANKDIKSLNLLRDFIVSYFDNLGDDIDQIMLAHKVIDYLKNNNSKKLFTEITYFKEDDLLPLEKELLSVIAEEVNETSVLDLFGSRREKKSLKSINPRYGTRNEVAHVIKDIISNKYPLDECQIVLINKPVYTNELFKFMLNYDLKMTFEGGIPINLSDAYKLYTTINNLEKKYFYDVNGYLNLFSSESLDLEKLGVKHKEQVAQLLGRMKIKFEKDKNDGYLQEFNFVKDNYTEEFKLILEKIDRQIAWNLDEILNEVYHVIDELSQGKAYFIEEYTKQNIPNDDFHQKAVEFIAETIEYSESDKIPQEIKKSYLASIDNKYLNNQLFKDDAIHVTTIQKALSSFRKHTYIIGLNSAFYPGSLTEDFLFSDDLYEQLTITNVKNITEDNLNKKNDYLKTVIETYLSLGIDLSLSYNCQEIKEVRELNPCSVLLDYATEFFGDPEALNKLKEKCSYYDDGLSALSNIEDIVVNNNDIKEKQLDVLQVKSDGTNNKGTKLLDASYSPSKIPEYLRCPLKFYLDNIVGADNEITYDNLRPMSGNRFGDLIHYVMEHFIKDAPNASKDEIVSYGEILYGLYTKIDRSISDDNLEKKPFLASVEHAYNYLKKNYIIKGSLTEEKVGYGKDRALAKIGEIHFNGSIDLVTKDKDGNYVILDYKTGSNVEHIDNDINTCIQALIYANLFKQKYGHEVSKVVFYYTRFDKVITFDNPCSDEVRKELEERIALFAQALKDLQFPIASKETQEEACKYCKYMNICHKDAGGDEDASEE